MTSTTNSPALYRKWAAIAGISSALQRKVFAQLNGGIIYPNLYVIFVGGPGIGKSQTINPIRGLLGSLEHVSLSPARITNEKFIQLLAKSYRMVPTAIDPYFTQCAYSAYIAELSTLIRPKDIDMMTLLTDFYDCPKNWSYSTLSRDTDRVENLALTLVGAITPKALAENFGSAAFGMGFTSRLNMIFADEYKVPKLFQKEITPSLQELVPDFKAIHRISGEYLFSSEAAEVFQRWLDEGMAPVPSDGRLAEYLPRRWLHLAKLCMIYAASEGEERMVQLSHYQKAKATLLEAEAVLPGALEFLGSNSSMEAIRNAHNWIKAEWLAKGKPVSEMALKRKLLVDVHPQYLNQTILEMVQSGLLVVSGSGSERNYVPKL